MIATLITLDALMRLALEALEDEYADAREHADYPQYDEDPNAEYLDQIN